MEWTEKSAVENHSREINFLENLQLASQLTPVEWVWWVFDEYLKLGVIGEVQTQADVDNVVYLTQKEVLNEEMSIIKSRIVFDASAKYKGTLSLNDVHYKGVCRFTWFIAEISCSSNCINCGTERASL